MPSCSRAANKSCKEFVFGEPDEAVCVGGVVVVVTDPSALVVIVVTEPSALVIVCGCVVDEAEEVELDEDVEPLPSSAEARSSPSPPP